MTKNQYCITVHRNNDKSSLTGIIYDVDYEREPKTRSLVEQFERMIGEHGVTEYFTITSSKCLGHVAQYLKEEYQATQLTELKQLRKQHAGVFRIPAEGYDALTWRC